MRLIKRLWLKKLNFQTLTFNEGEKGFFEEVEFIFKTLFFVFMGISMRVGTVERCVCWGCFWCWLNFWCVCRA